MYIRNKTMNKGKDKYYIIENRIKINNKLITKNIRYLGTAKKILSDYEELDKLRNKHKKTLT
jgi:hypothetical protein